MKTMKHLRFMLATMLALLSATGAWAQSTNLPGNEYLNADVKVDGINYILDETDMTAGVYQSDFNGYYCDVPETIVVNGKTYRVDELIWFNSTNTLVSEVNLCLPKSVKKLGQITSVKYASIYDDYHRKYVSVWFNAMANINVFISASDADIDLHDMFGYGRFNIYLLGNDYNSFKEPNTYTYSTQVWVTQDVPYSRLFTYTVSTSRPYVYTVPGSTASSRLHVANAILQSSGLTYYNNIYIQNAAGGAVISDNRNHPASIFNIPSTGGTKSVEYVSPMWNGFKILPNDGNAPVVEYYGKRVFASGPDKDGYYTVVSVPVLNNTQYEVSYVPKSANITVKSNGGAPVGILTYTADGTAIRNTLDASGGSKTQAYNFVTKWENLVELEIDYDESEYDVSVHYTDGNGNYNTLNYRQDSSGKKTFYMEYVKGYNPEFNVTFTPKSKRRSFSLVNFGGGLVEITGERDGAERTLSWQGYAATTFSFDYGKAITIEVTPPEGEEVKSITGYPVYIVKSYWSVDETTGKVTVDCWSLPKEDNGKGNSLQIKYGPKAIPDGTQFNVHIAVEGDEGYNSVMTGDMPYTDEWYDSELNGDEGLPFEMSPGENIDFIGVYNSDEEQYLEFYVDYSPEASDTGLKTQAEVICNGAPVEPSDTKTEDDLVNEHYLIPIDGNDVEVRVVYSSNGRFLTGLNGDGGTLAVYSEGSTTPLVTLEESRGTWTGLPKEGAYNVVITPNQGRAVTAILRNGSLLAADNYRQADGTFLVPLAGFADGTSTYQLQIVYGDGDVSPWIWHRHEGEEGSFGELVTQLPGNQRRAIGKLSMTGRLNGTDLRGIRYLAGADNAYGKPATDGRLHYLDLSQARLVSGFAYYTASDGTTYYMPSRALPKYMLIDTKIDTLLLPQDLRAIESLAFTGALPNMTVVAPWKEPLALDDNPFGTDVAGMTLAVPRGSKALYEADTNWSQFGTIKDQDLTGSIKYSLQLTGAKSLLDYAEMKVGNCYVLDAASYRPYMQWEMEASLIGSNRNLYIKVYAAGGKSVKLAFRGEDYTSLLVNKGVQTEGTFEGCTLYEYEGTDCDPFFVEGEWVVSLEQNIVFADPAVKAICVQYWDRDEDGELSFSEAAAVTTLVNSLTNKSVFQANKTITSFDELQYFTGLTSIEERAFYGCTALTSIVLPPNVKTIETWGLCNCSSLKIAVLPESLTSIGNYALNGTGLQTLFIPKNVEEITIGSTSYSLDLVSIVVDKDNPYYTSLETCNGIFDKRTSGSLKLVAGCQTTTIPEGVTDIEESAFFYQTGLTAIELPSTLTSIGSRAFAYCNLQQVVSHATTPPTRGSNSFSNIGSSCKLTVPRGTRDAYIAAGWTESIFPGGVVEETDVTATAEPIWTMARTETGNDFYWVYDTTEGASANSGCYGMKDLYGLGVNDLSAMTIVKSDYRALEVRVKPKENRMFKVFFCTTTTAESGNLVSSYEDVTSRFQAVTGANYLYAFPIAYGTDDWQHFATKTGTWLLQVEKEGGSFDVNDDGHVTIADVTKLVNVILGKD